MRSIAFAIAWFCLMPCLGCLGTASKRNKEWNKSFTYLSIIRTNFAEPAKLNLECPANYKTAATKLNWVEQVQCYMQDENNSAVSKAALRNRIIEHFVTMVNHAYGDYEHDSTVARGATNVGFDFINLGLTGAAAIFSSQASTLGAVGTATQGLSHSIDKNFYNSVTTFVINNKMEALRLEQLAQIRAREALPVECERYRVAEDDSETKGSQLGCYSLAQAMNDVQELYYAGTVHRALQSINTQSAEQAKTAQEKLTTPNTKKTKSNK